MRMPPAYGPVLAGAAQSYGCTYMTPPTEYHRYSYRGHRNPLDYAATGPERYHDVYHIEAGTFAQYVDGDTFTIAIQIREGAGLNGAGIVGHYETWTFEIDTDGGGVTPGNIQIDITGLTTAAQCGAAIYAVVNATIHGYATVEIDSTSTIVYVVGQGPKVNLTFANSGVPNNGAVGSSSQEDCALQPIGGRPGMIQYRTGAGSVPGVIGAGVQSLFMTWAP